MNFTPISDIPACEHVIHFQLQSLVGSLRGSQGRAAAPLAQKTHQGRERRPHAPAGRIGRPGWDRMVGSLRQVLNEAIDFPDGSFDIGGVAPGSYLLYARDSSALEELESDIHAAHEAVNHDPPNYFLAGSVSAACLYCHTR